MGWERQLVLWIHAYRTPELDRVFLFSRWLGNTRVLAALVAAMAVWHAARRETRAAATWLLAGLAALGIGWELKALTHRLRPHLWPWAVNPGDSSFPSGHALGTSMAFILLAGMVPKTRPELRRAAHLAAAIVIVYVGFGRLYLGMHWPTDVLAGWAIGLGIAAVARRYLRQGRGGSGGTVDAAGKPT